MKYLFSTNGGQRDMTLTCLSSEYQAFTSSIEKEHIEEVTESLRVHPEFLDLARANGLTPLHWASYKGRGSMVRLLLRHRPTSVDLVALNGTTPLHLAVVNRSDSTVKSLLRYATTSINLPNVNGMTP